MTLLSTTASWADEEHRMFAESASKFLEIELAGQELEDTEDL